MNSVSKVSFRPGDRVSIFDEVRRFGTVRSDKSVDFETVVPVEYDDMPGVKFYEDPSDIKFETHSCNGVHYNGSRRRHYVFFYPNDTFEIKKFFPHEIKDRNSSNYAPGSIKMVGPISSGIVAKVYAEMKGEVSLEDAKKIAAFKKNGDVGDEQSI